jgi:hypothetical protein
MFATTVILDHVADYCIEEGKAFMPLRDTIFDIIETEDDGKTKIAKIQQATDEFLAELPKDKLNSETFHVGVIQGIISVKAI